MPTRYLSQKQQKQPSWRTRYTQWLNQENERSGFPNWLVQILFGAIAGLGSVMMYPAYLAKWEGKPWDYPIITTAKGGGQVVHPLYQMFAIGSCLMLLGTLLILLALAFRGASDTANT